MQEELKNKVIVGVQWSTLSTIVTSVAQMARLAILARFLEKSDFGLIAIVTFVFGMIEMISDLGFSSAIMHKKELQSGEFNSLFWIQMVVFVLMFCLMSFASYPVALFYEQPSLTELLPISLLGLLFMGVGKLYDTVFQKEFQFKTIALRNIASAIISCVFAVLFAIEGCGVYSLILSTLIQHAIFNIWSFIAGQRFFKIGLHLSFKEVKGLVKIGLYQTGTQILNYLTTQLDVLIIGKILGMDVLGVYNLARDLLMKFTSLINSVANRVALPLFSHIQDNVRSMCENYCKMVRLLTTINFPIVSLTGALSYPLIILIYGDRFADASVVVAVFASITMLGVVNNPSGLITTAKGRTDLSFVCMIVRLLITTPVLLLTAYASYEIFLAGKVLTDIILFVLVWYFMLWKVINMDFQIYVKSFIKRLLVSVVTYVLCYILLLVLFHNTSIFLQFLFGGGMFLLLYTLFTFFFNRQDIIELYKLSAHLIQL